MTPPGYVDIEYLRMRVKAHDLRDKGYPIMEIASSLGLSMRQAGYYVGLPKPQLPEMGCSQAWTDDAICTAADTELFFPPYRGIKSKNYKERAMKICARCPVIEKCRQTALVNCESFGVWGGEDFSKYMYELDAETGELSVSVRRGDDAIQKVG